MRTRTGRTSVRWRSGRTASLLRIRLLPDQCLPQCLLRRLQSRVSFSVSSLLYIVCSYLSLLFFVMINSQTCTDSLTASMRTLHIAFFLKLHLRNESLLMPSTYSSHFSPGPWYHWTLYVSISLPVVLEMKKIRPVLYSHEDIHELPNFLSELSSSLQLSISINYPLPDPPHNCLLRISITTP